MVWRGHYQTASDKDSIKRWKYLMSLSLKRKWLNLLLYLDLIFLMPVWSSKALDFLMLQLFPFCRFHKVQIWWVGRDPFKLLLQWEKWYWKGGNNIQRITGELGHRSRTNSRRKHCIFGGWASFWNDARNITITEVRL